MNFKGIINKGKYTFEQNKGLIYTILSAGFEIAAVVAMAKQAPKAEKVLIPANEKIKKLKDDMNNPELVDNKEVYVEDNKKAIRKIQRQTFGKLVKIYSAPVIFTGLSIAFMGSSYKVMRDKQIALGAAYVTLENAYKSYRNRVKEKFGAETENDIFRDMREEKVKKQVTDEKTGEVKEIEEIVKRANSGGAYELFFDAASLQWSPNGRANYERLMEIQTQANITLRAKGYMYLYDVIALLGLPESIIDKDLLLASRHVGWIWNPYDSSRSSCILLGISDETGHYNEVGKLLFDNVERDCWLSFNVDGIIDIPDKNGETFVNYIRV